MGSIEKRRQIEGKQKPNQTKPARMIIEVAAEFAYLVRNDSYLGAVLAKSRRETADPVVPSSSSDSCTISDPTASASDAADADAEVGVGTL